MMLSHTINHLLRNSVFFQEVDTLFNVGSFFTFFIRNHLTDIMKQTSYSNNFFIGANLSGDRHSNVYQFQGVLNKILAKRETVFKSSEHGDYIFGKIIN